MNDLQIFNSEEFGEIRTVTINDEPYFVGKDIAEALGYAKARNALAAHVDEDDKKDAPIQGTLGGTQTMTVINESGIYALIFGSKLESAKRFKHWVTSEVLPALRKTGAYQMQNLSKEMKAILMHDEKIVKIENRMDKLEYDIPLYGPEADEICAHVKRRAVYLLGGKKSEAYKDRAIRDKLFKAIYNQMKIDFDIYDMDGRPKSYKNMKRKYLSMAHEMIDAYEPPYYLQELIDNANAQETLF